MSKAIFRKKFSYFLSIFIFLSFNCVLTYQLFKFKEFFLGGGAIVFSLFIAYFSEYKAIGIEFFEDCLLICQPFQFRKYTIKYKDITRVYLINRRNDTVIGIKFKVQDEYFERKFLMNSCKEWEIQIMNDIINEKISHADHKIPRRRWFPRS